jgi:arsenite-transporting ATPase
MAENPVTSEEKKVIVFSGKGGVGKTTIAAATALNCALEGEKTLIISTDPAPSLSHIFEKQLKDKPAKVLENLYFDELGFDEVKKMWEAKFGGEVYQIFSSFVKVPYEEFTNHIITILPGLTEEFMVNHIKELFQSGQYQRIIWDTAPLGQTLGLFKVPSMFIEHLRTAPRIYSQLTTANESSSSIFDIIKNWRELSQEDMNFLKDDVKFVTIAIPEALSVQQLEGIFDEFDRYEIEVKELIVNHVIRNSDSEFLLSKSNQQKKYLQYIYQEFGFLKIREVPEFAYEIKGLEKLKEVDRSMRENTDKILPG